MVSRRKNPADNRFTFVRLTDEGRKKIVAYQDEKQRFISKVLTGFTEKERSSLLEMLTRVQDNVKNIHPND
jgi:DNA-binding MarR family transcriptional regulator